jgi:hypothetical protein
MYDLDAVTRTTILKIKEGDTVHYKHHFQTIESLFWNNNRLYVELDNDKIIALDW